MNSKDKSYKEYKMIRVNKHIYKLLKDSKEYPNQSFNSMFHNRFKKVKSSKL